MVSGLRAGHLVTESREWLMVAVLCVVCVAATIVSCSNDRLSGSFSTLHIAGGYSDIRSSDIEFKCSNGNVLVEAVTSYWDSDVPEKRTQGLVQRHAYVRYGSALLSWKSGGFPTRSIPERMS